LKLHLGCGRKLLDGYVNIDKYVVGEGIINLDILDLPYEESSVTEIVAEHVLEHIAFEHEKKFLEGAHQILKKGGVLKIEVPDLERVLTQFLQQKDDFKDFYQVGAVDHYFGNGIEPNNRWGILTTHIWGNQNGDGQFHKNGYTEEKLRAIGSILGFSKTIIKKDFNKGTQVLVVEFEK
jgi:predicted SAM-dependent methyltransferase